MFSFVYAKRHPISKITKEIFVKICWQLKVHALHYANQLLVRVRLENTFANSLNTVQKQYEKMFGKRVVKCTRCIIGVWIKCIFNNNNNNNNNNKIKKNVLVVEKSTDHDKPHFDLFFTAISKKIVFFFQTASWKRHCVTHWCEQRDVDSYGQRRITYIQPKKYCLQLHTCTHLLKLSLQGFSATLQPDCEISSNCGKKVSRARHARLVWHAYHLC